MATLLSILAAILVLSVLILVHELGHYGAARLLGVKVEEFSMFMGPKIWSHTSKAGIQYTLRSVPIGGYCRFTGEDEDSDDPQAFFRQKVWKRIVVTVAGAAMNFAFAYVLAVVMCAFLGMGTGMTPVRTVDPGTAAAQAQLMPGDIVLTVAGEPVNTPEQMQQEIDAQGGGDVRLTVYRGGKSIALTLPAGAETAGGFGATYETARIGTLETDYPAYEAGLREGDRIIAIDGVPMAATSDITASITAAGADPVLLTVERDGQTLTFSVTPKYDEAAQRARIGVGFASEIVTYGSDSFAMGVRLSINVMRQMFASLGALFTGGASVGDMMGPVGIVTEISSQAKQGFENVLQMALLISLNLGIVNLLPIPSLDGSRLIFLAIEGIRRKPFPRDKEAMVHFVGLMCLFVFLLFVTFNDVKRLFM